MAFPIGALLGALGSSGSNSGGSSQGGAGIGFNILGAPGDPFGVGMKLIADRRAREEEKRRYQERLGLTKEGMAEDKRQFGINTMLNKSNFERNAGMNAIQMLAGQRQNAMNTLGRQKLKDSYFKG